jgi:hypothetical protein
MNGYLNLKTAVLHRVSILMVSLRADLRPRAACLVARESRAAHQPTRIDSGVVRMECQYMSANPGDGILVAGGVWLILLGGLAYETEA